MPDLPAGRPIPDTDDLRLLAELINNVSIPLANAAWNARMSQSEAALRLVSMAERGLPLRLVADGDRQVLWHIAQAGPATSGVPVTGGSAPVGPPAPGAPSGAIAGRQAPAVVLPPTPAVPPHEQAIAGAVPLGEPPFGSPEPAPTTGPGEAAAAAPSPSPDSSGPLSTVQDPDALWGPAGSSSWARTDDDAGASMPSPAAESADRSTHDDPDRGRVAAASDAAPTDAAFEAARTAERAPRWGSRSVTGPGGEHLVVRILDVTDPGDPVLTGAGYRMEPGERAVLVHSSVQNVGQGHYYPIGDLFLVLESDQGVLLGKASVAVASHPAHPVGVAPGTTADGWSVFLIPSGTVVTGLKWCIRPDITQTIVSWPIAP